MGPRTVVERYGEDVKAAGVGWVMLVTGVGQGLETVVMEIVWGVKRVSEKAIMAMVGQEAVVTEECSGVGEMKEGWAVMRQ